MIAVGYRDVPHLNITIFILVVPAFFLFFLPENLKDDVNVCLALASVVGVMLFE